MVTKTINVQDNMVSLSEIEYHDMKEYMDRLKETVDLLSNKKEMKKIQEALIRIKSGKFLTKEELLNAL